ncbi:hypothetical protein [Parasitella parasitica]|uniref:Fungal lipase-like domain-containing protein n=1 Tax=Parasitella parasitica TaxID=35722 RepID=A0A0B7N2J6_9FUNG|nr:hypothetical protein [Parasitella parasitica]
MSTISLFEDGHGNVVDENGGPEPMDYIVDENELIVETIATHTEYLNDAPIIESFPSCPMLIQKSKNKDVCMKEANTIRDYVRYTVQDKVRIFDLKIEKCMSAAAAAQQLGINVRTAQKWAKAILGTISAVGLITVGVKKPKPARKREADGYISSGTVTGHYISFLKTTLDEMDKYPHMKGHYIAMDYAPIRTHENIQKYIEYRGYKYVFLPPYSPELNPIEQFWAVAKSKQVVMEITITIAFVVALLGYYLNYKGRWILSILCYLTSVFILSVPVVMFISFKTIQYFMPFIMRTLTRINQRLMPLANYLSHHRFLGPLLGIFIKSQFFMWFMVLMMSDQAIRIIMGRFAGQHASNQYLSLINVGDNRFFKSTHPSTENQQKQKCKVANYGQSNSDFKQPLYSLSVAHSLSVASKLAYEDVAVVQYELEKAGYDVEHTFKALGYKNVCAFVIEKDNNVLLVFRGTNPLNIQNYVTNVDAGLAKVSSSTCYMGKVHKGFWDAMGASENSDSGRSTLKQTSESDIHINLNSASLYQSIVASVLGVMRIMRALSFSIFANVLDPIDASWARHSSAATIRYQSMYTQSEEFILKLFADAAVMDTGKKKRFYITGHSLGGALATVFLAKMIQRESPLLEYFEGLYTYGQPNIGDQDFNIVPRIPYWYSPPPGTLVFIDSSYKICIYPPDQKTQKPIPLRNISYLHLSGLLNKHVIVRMRSETTIRILFRILLPFFINDHFPSDYSDALLSGDIQWVILGENEAGYDKEDEQRMTFPLPKRYSLQIGKEEEGIH